MTLPELSSSVHMWLVHAIELQPVGVALPQLVKSGMFAGVTTGQGYRDA